jgi:16S rRNA (uracil1498-N3)-methyltransferase
VSRYLLLRFSGKKGFTGQPLKLYIDFMRYFFIQHPKAAGSRSVLKGSDANHIKNVLRLRPGDKVGLFDGQGLEYSARIVAFSGNDIEVEIVQSFASVSESNIDIIVAQAYLKERKMDGLVRQLTELGVMKWIPFFAERSVPRPDDIRLANRRKRWIKITREALKQSRRGRIMEIGNPVSFEEMLKLASGCDLKIVYWENESKPFDSTRFQLPDYTLKQILVMLGPEGGFTASEIDMAAARGFTTGSLGPRILRAETATIAAVTLVQYLFGDMGKKS